jgi:hypothetical protein
MSERVSVMVALIRYGENDLTNFNSTPVAVFGHTQHHLSRGEYDASPFVAGLVVRHETAPRKPLSDAQNS